MRRSADRRRRAAGRTTVPATRSSVWRRMMSQVDRLAELSDRDVSIWLDSLNRERLGGRRPRPPVWDARLVSVSPAPPIFSSHGWLRRAVRRLLLLPERPRDLPPGS